MSTIEIDLLGDMVPPPERRKKPSKLQTLLILV